MVQPQEQVKPHMQQYWGQVLQQDQTVQLYCTGMLTVTSLDG